MFQKEFNQRVNIRQVLSLSSKDGRYPYPIDLNIKRAVNIELPYLLWYNYGTKPQNMKITNIGTSVVLSSRWEQDRPFLKSGPLPENYIFSQLHFHWGDDDGQGSQHTAEGRCFPMEMHVVHYKASYVHPRAAHNKPDGMVVVVYLFQIQGSDNESIDHLVNALPYVKEPFSSVEITPTTIEEYVVPFDKNYFLYWGSLKFQACDHKIMWLICREPIGVSRRQMCNFRKLNGPDHQPMSHMFFGVQSLFNRTLFLINGAPPLDRTLLPILSIGRVGIPTTINQETEYWPFLRITSCRHLKSPINIKKDKAIKKYFPPLTFLDWNLEGGRALVENTGVTAQVTIKDCSPLLEGGPLRGTYQFKQMHFHWSSGADNGTEHLINGKKFLLESHAVYFHVKCQSERQARKLDNAITVVANVFRESSDDNKDISLLSDNLKYIVKPHTQKEIPADFFSWFLKNKTNNYYTYPGSLTTPKKSKTVTWIVFPEPIKMSTSQIEGFRQLLNEDSQKIKHNCREEQKLNNRDIYLSI